MSTVDLDTSITWRYLPRGRVKHALRLDGHMVTGHRSIAICGTSPVWYAPEHWRGTGAQSEYEEVGRLPECRRCSRLLAGTQPEVSS